MSPAQPSQPKTTINPWQYKPWWCQPWSILLTGCTIVGLSWLVAHNAWITGIVALPMFSWMGYFLVVWPRLMQTYLSHDPD